MAATSDNAGDGMSCAIGVESNSEISLSSPPVKLLDWSSKSAEEFSKVKRGFTSPLALHPLVQKFQQAGLS